MRNVYRGTGLRRWHCPTTVGRIRLYLRGQDLSGHSVGFEIIRAEGRTFSSLLDGLVVFLQPDVEQTQLTVSNSVGFIQRDRFFSEFDALLDATAVGSP